jgi:hypothetical protein
MSEKGTINMNVTERLATHPVIRAALPFAFFAAFTAIHAKDFTVRSLRHTRSALYFQQRDRQVDADVWYTPTRSPGWHDETGS